MADNQDEKDKLLDHSYDGIQELDNHMPRWWVIGFYVSIAFAFVYMFYYHFAGGPLQIQEYENEIAAAKATSSHQTQAASSDLKPLTDKVSLAEGEKIFAAHTCSACHSPTLGGLVGPNLTDDFWMHGCDFTTVMGNIKKGFAQKGMLPYGNGKPMEEIELQKLVSYIFSKHGSKPAGAKAIDPVREVKCKPKA